MAVRGPKTQNLQLPLEGAGQYKLSASLQTGFTIIDQEWKALSDRISAFEDRDDESNSFGTGGGGPATAYDLSYDSLFDSNSEAENVGAALDDLYARHLALATIVAGLSPDDSNSSDGPATAYDLAYDSATDSDSDETNVGDALDELYTHQNGTDNALLALSARIAVFEDRDADSNSFGVIEDAYSLSYNSTTDSNSTPLTVGDALDDIYTRLFALSPDDSNSLDGPVDAHALTYNSISDSNSTPTTVGDALDDLYSIKIVDFPAKPVSARYYNMAGGRSTQTGGGATANQIYWHLFYVPFDEMTIDEIGARVTTTVAASLFQLAIYAVDWSTVRPTGNALAKTGSLNGTATAVVSGPDTSGNAFTLTRGWYFLGVNTTHAIAWLTWLVSPLPELGGSAVAGDALVSGGGTSLVLITPTITFGTWPDVTGGTFTENTAARGAVPVLRADGNTTSSSISGTLSASASTQTVTSTLRTVTVPSSNTGRLQFNNVQNINPSGSNFQVSVNGGTFQAITEGLILSWVTGQSIQIRGQLLASGEAWTVDIQDEDTSTLLDSPIIQRT